MVALRRPTESSKAAVATTTKSLSAVSLTKKTNALVTDVEELKNNLEIQSREVTQRDATVDMLHDAFNSLSDVCTCEIALYESQTELAHVKNTSEDLMTREREAAHLQKTLQFSQEDAVEALKRLKEDTSQLQVELFALKEQTNGATTSVASDIQSQSSSRSG
eukprot:jgi/Phyca11/13728/fgenesh1_pg.PHYCAscaffold_4_\